MIIQKRTLSLPAGISGCNLFSFVDEVELLYKSLCSTKASHYQSFCSLKFIYRHSLDIIKTIFKFESRDSFTDRINENPLSHAAAESCGSLNSGGDQLGNDEIRTVVMETTLSRMSPKNVFDLG